jgi:hypothetical protein
MTSRLLKAVVMMPSKGSTLHSVFVRENSLIGTWREFFKAELVPKLDKQCGALMRVAVVLRDGGDEEIDVHSVDDAISDYIVLISIYGYAAMKQMAKYVGKPPKIKENSSMRGKSFGGLPPPERTPSHRQGAAATRRQPLCYAAADAGWVNTS